MDELNQQQVGFQDRPLYNPGAPASDAQKEELASMMRAVRGKLNELNSSSIIGKNKTDAARSDAFLFAIEQLRQAGVDVNNPKAVADFIEKLRQKSPDLAEMFETAMEGLLPDDDEDEETSDEEDGDGEVNTPMNKYNEALSKDIRGRI